MFNTLFFPLGLFMAGLFLIRRMARRHPRQNLGTYIHTHEQAFETHCQAMRRETAMFSATEAMAPVEAGLRELLELHGSPQTVCLERREATLILRTAPSSLPPVAISWELRGATLSARAGRRHVHGNGHWELRNGDNAPEPYDQLATLMGRLSCLLRLMLDEGRADAPAHPASVSSGTG